MPLRSVIDRLTLPNDFPDKSHAQMVEEFKEGVIAESKGEIDEAYRIYMSVLKRYKPEGIFYWERTAIMLERAKRYKEAIRICDMALKLNAQHKQTAIGFKRIFTKRKERLSKKLKASKK